MNADFDIRWLSKNRALILVTILSALFVYGYPITNFAIHIDEEMGAIYGTITNNIGLGRWGISLVHGLILPDPVVPYFMPLISLLLMASAALVSCEILNLEGVQRYVFSLLYVSFPQFSYQLEFLNQTESVALGIVIATLGYFVMERGIEKRFISLFCHIFLSVVLFCLAVAFYQSILFVPSTLAVLCATYSLYRSQKSPALVMRNLVITFLSLIASYALYAVITKVIQHTFGVPNSTYFAHMVGWLQENWTTALSHTMLALRDDVTGATFYGSFIYATVWLPVLFVGIDFLFSKQSYLSKIFHSLLLISTILSPFAMVAVLGQQQEPRTFVAEQISYAGLWAMVFLRLSNFRRAAAIVTVVSLIYGCFHVTRLFFADTMAWQSDKLLGNRILMAIYRTDPDFEETQTPVYFSGPYHVDNFWRGDDYNIFGKSFFVWDDGNTVRINAFLKINGIADLKLPSISDINSVQGTVKTMPVWPNPKSVRLVNGIIVVRLGKTGGLWY
jgi:hypothetical protein